MNLVPQQKRITSELIESKIDKSVTSNLRVSDAKGGLDFANIGEVMEFAKIMAVSAQAVPPHCRNQVGVCLSITLQAIEWRMSPYAVANKSYVVNDRVAWESQLIHAVIEQRAPITGRLRHKFSGQGMNRRCLVWAKVHGESEPLEYTSPEFSTITPKNSPLWKSKPDLQLFYNTSRDWARVYFPDVIMGIYSDDELTVERIESRPKSLSELTERIMNSTDSTEIPRAESEAEESPEADAKETAQPSPVDEYLGRIQETNRREAVEKVLAMAIDDSELSEDEVQRVLASGNDRIAVIGKGK